MPMPMPMPMQMPMPLLKKKMIADFKMKGIPALSMLNEDQLSEFIHAANDAYYCNQAPLLSDNEYDILREYILDMYPDNQAALAGHTQ